MKKEKRGILLIALGHPNYGKMAYNLAVSLKQTSPDIKIHLVFTKQAISHLTEYQLNEFTSIAQVPEEAITRNGNIEYIKAKSRMYDLTPFETTIFLDVDMIWLTQKSVNKLFDLLADVDYTIQNRGFVDLASEKLDDNFSQWANINEIKKEYGFTEGKYYSFHSEFIYFKKNQSNRKFFNEWKKQYDNLKVKHTVFASGIPDELPLTIASVIHNKYPHLDNFVPVYWEIAEELIDRTTLIDDFYAFSIGGNRLTQNQIKTYEDFVKYYMHKIGSRITFRAFSKKNYLTERQVF